MNPLISVIVPNHNGEKTIGHCLKAVYGSSYNSFEIIVVDDCSADRSLSIIAQHPCRLLRLPEHGGASKARNTGAINSNGDVLFFIDADCLVQPDTLSIVAAAYQQTGPDVVIGGTYTLMPFDQRFFSLFQSVFIHCAETKDLQKPDYIATHAMVISADLFKTIGGFDEHFMPILEDVEFSHRLKEKGYRLRMDATILVQHIFNFNLLKSLKNGFKKSKYWTRYSIANKDLLSDSGTASQGLKFNVISCFLSLLLLLGAFAFGVVSLAVPMLLLLAANLLLNRSLIQAFYRTKGLGFTVLAVLYYMLLYPLAVGLGALNGLINHLSGSAL